MTSRPNLLRHRYPFHQRLFLRTIEFSSVDFFRVRIFQSFFVANLTAFKEIEERRVESFHSLLFALFHYFFNFQDLALFDQVTDTGSA